MGFGELENKKKKNKKQILLKTPQLVLYKNYEREEKCKHFVSHNTFDLN